MPSALPMGEAINAFMEEARKNSHVANVLQAGSMAEELLGRIIAGDMKNLSNRLRSKLFDGYGPLATFSVRIDIAFAMGLIDGNTRHNLHVLRDIRNEFAHSSKQRDLHEAPLTTLLAKFHGYDKAKDPLVMLFAAVETIFDKLTDTLANQKVIRLLRQSSSEKSVEPSSHR